MAITDRVVALSQGFQPEAVLPIVAMPEIVRPFCLPPSVIDPNGCVLLLTRRTVCLQSESRA
jgi:hypothetical protein